MGRKLTETGPRIVFIVTALRHIAAVNPTIIIFFITSTPLYVLKSILPYTFKHHFLRFLPEYFCRVEPGHSSGGSPRYRRRKEIFAVITPDCGMGA